MHVVDRLNTDERSDQNGVTSSPTRALVNKADVLAIVLLLIGLVWGILQRRHLPAVPLWTLDTSGYLYPALSRLAGDGFQQVNGRDWFYPAVIFLTIRFGGDFSWIVRLQQCLSLLAAPLMWFGVRLWLSISPQRSVLCHGAGVLLGAIVAFIYVSGTTQILHELTIGPEGLLSFFIVVSLVSALAYFRARWVTHKPRLAIVCGGGALLLFYLVILLKPSWSLAFIPVCCLLIVGIFGSGSRILRFAPVAVGLILLGGACSLPYLLEFKRDLASKTFLPFTLVSIHAGQIVENAERHHLLADRDPGSKKLEIRFYEALEQAYEASRVQPVTARTLGFDADYIMYRGKFFSRFQSEEKLTDEALIKLCYEAYFRVWRESPDLMIEKIAKEVRLFLTAPRQDFAAYALSRSWFLEEVASDPSCEVLLRDSKSHGYMDQPSYARYLGDLEKVYAVGLQIHRVNVQERYLALLVSKLSFWVQIAFFGAFFCVLFNRRFRDLRLSGWAVSLMAAALYGNVLTISIVHTLDLDRYRTSYVPALLLVLVIMTGFLIGCCERVFRVLTSSFVKD
jgi:hypothetical protein